MIIALKSQFDKAELFKLKDYIKSSKIDIHEHIDSSSYILALTGDISKINMDFLKEFSCIKDVRIVKEPYKLASRSFITKSSIISIDENVKLGADNFQFIAGPCSVESEEQICQIALKVKAAGAKILRGGAFKPRTSPYTFQGLRADGIKLLLKAKEVSKLPIVTEIMDLSQLDLFDDVDIIQVGARNMQNFELLKELGKLDKPVLLKRGLSSTVNEFLMSAEYILAGGNENVILCERGIRTFETTTRNTLDLSAVPVIKELSHLPIIVDPSHATGVARFVKPMALAGAAAGADGLMIEVHNDPAHALSDSEQAVTPEEFSDIVNCVNSVLPYAFKG